MAVFQAAKLQNNANFSSANLSNASLSNADLNGTQTYKVPSFKVSKQLKLGLTTSGACLHGVLHVIAQFKAQEDSEDNKLACNKLDCIFMLIKNTN